MSTSDQSEETNFIPAIDADTEELSSADLSVIEHLQVGSAMLLVQRGPDAGARFLLDQDEVSVGRHPSSDIFLDDITVSRKHASIMKTDKYFKVVDMGSLNGIYVNGKLIEEKYLENGDKIQIGKYVFYFFCLNNE